MGVELTKAVALKQQRQARPREKRIKPARRIEPTPEQQEKDSFASAGMAFEKTPVIKTLLHQGRITQREYDALFDYAYQVAKAEDMAKQSSSSDPEKMMTSGSGKTVSGTIPNGLLHCPYKYEKTRQEAAMGDSALTASAICVRNQSLSQHAIEIFGGREHKGRIVPKRDYHVQLVLDDLKAAAAKIVI